MKLNTRWTLIVPACAAVVAVLVAYPTQYSASGTSGEEVRLARWYSSGTSQLSPRSIELDETIKVAIPQGVREVRLWIPKPPNGGPQSAELEKVASPLPYKITSEPEFGNQTVFLQARQSAGKTLEVQLKYRIARRPEESFRADKEPPMAYRTPRGLVTVNGEIRKIAEKQTQGITDPVEKGRALYQYVLKRMTYDKSGRGWGRGDSIYACRVGKGNCTDFHSLFMALAMASGIPARFRMGLSLPEASEGTVSGYHCWAEFYAKGSWIPVDISEAWKNPRRADYYFGHLDVNRVLVSTGREIRLEPPQKGAPLNFLYRPYAEVDGKPLYDIEFIRSYKNIGGPA